MGFGHFLKGAADAVGKKVDDLGEGLGEVATDVGKTGASVGVGFASSVTDAIAGAQNARQGPLHHQGVDRPVTSTSGGLSGAVAAGGRQTIQHAAREQGRTPQQAYTAAFEDPRVKAAARTTGRAVGTVASRAVDPTGRIQDRVFGRDVIAGAGEKVGASLINQAAAPGYFMDPNVIGAGVHGAGVVAQKAKEHPELIAPTAKALATKAVKKAATPENAIAFAVETAAFGGVGAVGSHTRSGLFTEASEAGLAKLAAKDLAGEATETAAESAAAKVTRGGIGEFGAERIEQALQPKNVRAPALTTEQMAVPKPGARYGPSLLERGLTIGEGKEADPVKGWFAEKRTEAATKFLETRQNPTGKVNQIVSSTIQGTGGTRPALIPGQTAETMASQEAKWAAKQALTQKGKAAVIPGYVAATAHPGQFAMGKAEDIARSPAVQERLQAEAKQRLGTEIRDQIQTSLESGKAPDLDSAPQVRFDDLKAQADQLKTRGQELQQDSLITEEQQGPNYYRQRRMAEEEAQRSGGQQMAEQQPWPTSTVSPNGVPAPEGMEESVSQGRRTGAFQQGRGGRGGRAGRPAMKPWQGPNREAFGGITPDHDWRPFKQRPIQEGHGQYGFDRGGKGEEAEGAAKGATEESGIRAMNPKTEPPEEAPALVPATPEGPKPSLSAQADFSPEMSKSSLYDGMAKPAPMRVLEQPADGSRNATFTSGITYGLQGGFTSTAPTPTVQSMVGSNTFDINAEPTKQASSIAQSPLYSTTTAQPQAQTDALNPIGAAASRPNQTPKIKPMKPFEPTAGAGSVMDGQFTDAKKLVSV